VSIFGHHVIKAHYGSANFVHDER